MSPRGREFSMTRSRENWMTLDKFRYVFEEACSCPGGIGAR